MEDRPGGGMDMPGAASAGPRRPTVGHGVLLEPTLDPTLRAHGMPAIGRIAGLPQILQACRVVRERPHELDKRVRGLRRCRPLGVVSINRCHGLTIRRGYDSEGIVTGFARFGPKVAEQALVIAECESSLDPDATGNLGERGLMQVYPRYHAGRVAAMGYRLEDLYDPQVNVEVAADIYAESGWVPWSCRTALRRGK